jgi:hypothetical protein
LRRHALQASSSSAGKRPTATGRTSKAQAKATPPMLGQRRREDTSILAAAPKKTSTKPMKRISGRTCIAHFQSGAKARMVIPRMTAGQCAA